MMKQKLKKRIVCISILFNILLPLLNLFSGQVLAKDDKDGKKLSQYIGEFLREIWISKLTEFDNSELDREDATVEFALNKQEYFSSLNISGDVLESTGMFLWPIPGYTKVGNKYTYSNDTTKGHDGIDVFAPEGTMIYAAADGVVSESKFSGTPKDNNRKWWNRIW